VVQWRQAVLVSFIDVEPLGDLSPQPPRLGVATTLFGLDRVLLA
jgi:hypothetical protein